MASHKKLTRNTSKAKKTLPYADMLTRHKQLTPGRWFEKLVDVQARLRAPNGCPWDREQTHETLRTYLMEETYEVLEALDSGDHAKFAEELGDLLLQVVFHAQIAREEGRFGISDVIREIHDKLVRRHPHVFGKTRAKDSAEVLRNWEQIKAAERHSRNNAGEPANDKPASAASLMDGISRALPATLEGFQLTRRAARIGFDWEEVEGIFEKLGEEAQELRRSLKFPDRARVEEEVGDLLFVAINLSRFLKIDPEIALKRANAKFSRRFRAMEKLTRDGGREFKDLPREEMEALWEATKKIEGNPSTEDLSGARTKR